MGLVSLGSLINRLNWFTNDWRESEPKIQLFHAVGVALVTTTPATSIAVNVLSRQQDVANKPLVIPTGANIYYIGIRTESALIGTTGEQLKAGAAHTDTAPVITAAAGAFAAGFARSAGIPGSTLAAPLGTLGAPRTMLLLNSNAGNTAAGTGVSCSATAKSAYTSAGTVPVIVEVCYYTIADPATVEIAYKAG